MTDCIDRGLTGEGILPGGLKVRRRARGIHERLLAERGQNLTAPHTINDWISVYAIAVNEENAAGAQVVTAPTNGASGVVPATIRYFLDHVPGASAGQVPEFLLTAAAVGALIKSNASISGAEVGCQGEVGSAAAMAAAGLAAVLGGTPAQIENAAEIALEHHLGMTCDPIAGLVQAPCIERNGLGAIKAVSAACLALRGDGQHLVSLDACIETMRQTGRDMDARYKETSLGGPRGQRSRPAEGRAPQPIYPGAASQGIRSRRRPTTMPRAIKATPVTVSASRPRGNSFSTKTTSVSSSIQARLITPAATSTANSAQQQPRQ